MDLLWMVLLLVLVGSEAQHVVNATGELGRDVTLTCSINQDRIYWLTKIYNRFRIEIGNTVSSKSSFYSSPDFKSKFSMSENRLVIKNLSAEDIRFYYCGRKENDVIVYLDTFSLLPGDDQVVGSNTSSTTSGPDVSTPSSPIAKWHKEPAVGASFTLNAVLLVVVLGFLCAYVRRKGCCCCRAKESAKYSTEDQEMQNAQYEEIQLPSTRVPFPPTRVSSDCIYYKAQHPDCLLPQY
ncbi:uncharacterized protein FYW61_021779 isoform 2-T2 [Anableps anableps]